MGCTDEVRGAYTKKLVHQNGGSSDTVPLTGFLGHLKFFRHLAWCEEEVQLTEDSIILYVCV